MRSTQDSAVSVRAGSVSLILPITNGSAPDGDEVVAYRAILENQAGLESVEVIVSRGRRDAILSTQPQDESLDDPSAELGRCVWSDNSEWPTLVRAGLAAASGDHFVVLDVNRHYTPESLIRVLDPIRGNQCDMAVAVPGRGRFRLASHLRSWLGLGFISRLFLGTSDVFSGLFALRRNAWDSEFKHRPARGSILVLDTLLRRQARSMDVPVSVGNRFRTGRIGLKDVRPLKHLLDRRFGNYSRLVQFCIVGASGMFVDLSLYALLQHLLSYTWLADRKSVLFGDTWHLVIAAGMSIGCALVWNFMLNRRLTFNDAHKGALLRQFLTYVLSNALAILLSFSVRLYLPAHVAFFERHRLAAAVVGIVAATGISFSMSRWLVFSRRTEPKLVAHFPLDHPPAVGQSIGHP
jgi:dolichol-phosphate mannosyltransferase